MVLFICCSHLYVPITLTLSYGIEGRCIVYTDKQSVADLFGKINKEKFLCIVEPVRQLQGIFRAFSIQKYKKELKRIFSGYHIDVVYFYHDGYCIPANWLMKYLRKRHSPTFCFCPISLSIDWLQQFRKVSPKVIYYFLLVLLQWGYYIDPIEHGDTLYPMLSRRFFNKLGPVSLERDVDYTLVNRLVNTSLLSEEEFSPNGIVLLQNVRIGDIVDVDEYTRLLNSLLEKITPHQQVYFKMHPDMRVYYGREEELKEIPSFISGNLLMKRFKCFIGYDSAMLAEVAELGTTAISMINIFQKDSGKKQSILQYMHSLSDKVLYPNSVDELVSML